MLEKSTYFLNCLIKEHSKPWQLQLGRTYALVTALIAPIITLALTIALVASDSPYAARTLPYFAAATILSEILYVLSKKDIVALATIYLVALFLLLSFAIVWSVGIGAGSMVLCSGAIILAGTICGYWCALVPAKISTVFLLAFRAAELQGLVHPEYVMSEKPANFSTVILMALLFHLLAGVSAALHRLEETRRKLKEAETNFTLQQSLLSHKLKRQSQKLQSAASERTRQLYRLAEVGEVSTALMHDLANNLTSLAFEIDNIETTEGRANVRRARNQLKQITNTFDRTRQQMKGQYTPNVFDVAKEVSYIVGLLRTTAKKSQVLLKWTKPEGGGYGCLGEKVLFQQLLSNIINNAIESYEAVPIKRAKRSVLVKLRAQPDTLTLTITDWGKGIEPDIAAKVFEPFYTTKASGMGMGLYLTKRFIEGSFSGSIELKASPDRTTFIITLPRQA